MAVRLCELALLVTAVFSVATAFEQLHRYLELFSHFRLQYFLASALLAFVFIYLRWRNYALLGLACVLFNGYFVVPWYLPPGVLPGEVAKRAEDFGKPIKLLHANVQISNDNPVRFIQLVQAQQPDIIVIQEATPRWLASLGEIASSYPHKLTESRDDPYGIALYSRFPLDKTIIIASEPRGHPEILARAIVGSKHLNIISSHPLQPIGAANFGFRNVELDAVAKLASRTPKPVIVIGDLNITMWASHYRRFEQTSGLKNARRGFGIEPTWPSFFFPAMIPIDHCLVSDDIYINDFTSQSGIGSDHLPVICTISLAL